MILEASNISKSYVSQDHPTGLKILDSLNLKVQQAEFVSLMGPSGCGKSTLLSILYGLDSPDHGEVKISQKNLNQLKGDHLSLFRSQTVGMIFQQFHLLPFLTAIENILFPLQLKGISDQTFANELLNDLDIQKRRDHYPHQMSRGECQRVAIARALILKPKILLADEPTGSLDQKTALDVLKLLTTILTPLKMALLLVTHDPKMIQFCHRHLRFEKGALVDSSIL